MDELLAIGRFARRAGMTVAALRHYHDVGLLVPAEVDPATGYRRYRADQLPQAWAIARLRALELSLDEIRAVLAGETDVLGRHRERVERRIWRLQRVHYRLQRLIEREDNLMSEPVTYDVEHRRLGVELFNDTWRLIESREDDETMVNEAHASAYHWSRAPECRPENLARGHWMISRVYALVGRAEPALHHARRCLELCDSHDLRDWDLGFAYEALARAHRVAGDAAAVARYRSLAEGVEIADAEDRDLLVQDLATL